MSTATATAPAPLELAELPQPGLRDATLGLQAHFRPGAQGSALSRLGERFAIDRPGVPKLLVTSSPDDAKAILTDRSGALSLGHALHRLTPHPVLFGADSLIFLDGDEHVRERRALGPPFHGEMMRSYEEEIAALASDSVSRWPSGEPVEFVELAKRFVLDVMRSILFGVQGGERMRRLDCAMLAYCDVTESDVFLGAGILGVVLTGRWRGYPPLDRAAAAVDEIVLEEVAERRAAGAFGSGDCLGLLLELNQSAEHPKPDATLARDLRGLMLAGYETTAVTLGWVVAMLARHPDAIERARAEAEAGSHEYIDAVITEVMRLRPIFPFTGRRAMRDATVNGIRLPEGAIAVISIMAVHEREDLYDDPLCFRPERFLARRPGTYTWLSFGGGPHRCIGAALAAFESRLLLAALLRQRDLVPVGERLEPPRRTHPMLIPADGARVRLPPR
jgi:cytochrome P450